MTDRSETMRAVSRAGRRATFHLLQAAVEGLKAIEAILDEIGGIGEKGRENGPSTRSEKIEIE